MKDIRIHLLIFLWILLVSCSKPETTGLWTVDVPKNAEKGIELSEIAASVNKIKLENHKDGNDIYFFIYNRKIQKLTILKKHHLMMKEMR